MSKILKDKILIINGVNLSQLGTRETNIYGAICFEGYLEKLRARYNTLNIEYFQDDLEGNIAQKIANAKDYAGILLNAGAYTHTSIVLADAVRTCPCRVIEIHISNLFGREHYRRESVLSSVCHGFISGFGLDGYRLGIEAIIENN